MDPVRLFCATPGYAPWVVTALRGGERLVFRDPPSACPVYRLVHVDAGSLRARIGGALETARPGRVLLLLPGVAYHIQGPSGLRVTAVTFSVRAADGAEVAAPGWLIGRLPRDPPPPAVWGCELPEILAAEDVAQVLPRVQRIAALWWQGDWERFQANRVLGDLLAGWAGRCRGAGEDVRPLAHRERIAAFVEERLDRGLAVGVEDLARFAGLSRSHFSRSFRRQAGCSPRELIVRLRLDRAQRLLAGRALDCRSVALRCGYASYAAFARSYRRRFGQWPSEE